MDATTPSAIEKGTVSAVTPAFAVRLGFTGAASVRSHATLGSPPCHPLSVDLPRHRAHSLTRTHGRVYPAARMPVGSQGGDPHAASSVPASHGVPSRRYPTHKRPPTRARTSSTTPTRASVCPSNALWTAWCRRALSPGAAASRRRASHFPPPPHAPPMASTSSPVRLASSEAMNSRSPWSVLPARSSRRSVIA